MHWYEPEEIQAECQGYGLPAPEGVFEDELIEYCASKGCQVCLAEWCELVKQDRI
jgi:hypothetical protein